MKKILVLSSAESDYTIEANHVFVREISARLPEAAIDVCHYRDVALYITPGEIVATRLSTGEQLSEYDLVYFKSFYRYSELASAIASYLQQENVRYICHEIDQAVSFSKLTQYARLARQQLPIIPTVFVERQQWRRGAQLIKERFGFPCIFKAIDAKGGDANYKVDSAEELLAAAGAHDGDFVAQELVPNEYDLRVLVANGDVKCVIKRQRSDDTTHLNNTSKGAAATLVPLADIDETTIQCATQSAAVFSREIAGVDIMRHRQTGELVILEVNASPQVATGAFQDEKLTVYATLFKDLLEH